MGTRGAFGFRIDGSDKITYNHWDSYPGGLGEDLVAFIQEIIATDGMTELKDTVRKIKLIDTKVPPTEEDKIKFAPLADISVSERTLDDWYCLLRKAQGDISKILTYEVMIDSHTFLQDSLFCEWAFIINLDEMVFEVYKGFQESKHNKGRYASLASKEGMEKYAPVALEGTFSLNSIPANWIEIVDPQEDD